MKPSSEKPDDVKSGAMQRFRVTRAARIALIALHVAAIAAVLTEWFYPFPANSHAVERVHALDFPASYAVYGFTACVILVLLGLLLRRLVMRDEDYYRGGGWW